MASEVSPVAAHVISRVGGPAVVCDWLGLTRGGVYKLTQPREKGGTGGLIPAFHQATMIERAKAIDLDLGPDDFHEVQHGGRAAWPIASANEAA